MRRMGIQIMDHSIHSMIVLLAVLAYPASAMGQVPPQSATNTATLPSFVRTQPQSGGPQSSATSAPMRLPQSKPLTGFLPLPQPEDRLIEADCREVRGLHPKGFRMVVGAGRAREGLQPEWQRQMKMCHDELGIGYVRCHGVLHDDMGIYPKPTALPPLRPTGPGLEWPIGIN